jgi:hypothetical protein
MTPEDPAGPPNAILVGFVERGGRPDDKQMRLTESWADRLAGVPKVLEIPSDKPCPDDTSGGRLPVELSVETTNAVLERSRALEVTASAFLLAAFGLALGRLTGADMLLVGVVSPTGDLLPVRIDIDDDRTRATSSAPFMSRLPGA